MSPVKGGKWRHPQQSEDGKRIIEEAKRFKAHIKREVPEREKYAKMSKSILNKLAPANFEKLKVQLYDIAKLYEEYCIDVTKAIYTKAWSEVKYTELYAKL